MHYFGCITSLIHHCKACQGVGCSVYCPGVCKAFWGESYDAAFRHQGAEVRFCFKQLSCFILWGSCWTLHTLISNTHKSVCLSVCLCMCMCQSVTAAHLRCESHVPPHPKGALLDWDLVTVEAIGVQWSHWWRNQFEMIWALWHYALSC